MRQSIALLLLLAIPAALPQPIVLWKSSPELVEKCALNICGEHQGRFALLRKLFQGAECRDKQLAEQPVAGAERKNLICTMEGKRPIEDTAEAINNKTYYESYLSLCTYFDRLDQTIDGSMPRFSDLLANPLAVTGPRPSGH